SARLPAPADGIDALARGGGVLGYLAAAPLEALVPPVAVIILHSVLIAFGVLVLPATPVESIPSRLRGVYEVTVARSEEEPAPRGSRRPRTGHRGAARPPSAAPHPEGEGRGGGRRARPREFRLRGGRGLRAGGGGGGGRRGERQAEEPPLRIPAQRPGGLRG